MTLTHQCPRSDYRTPKSKSTQQPDSLHMNRYIPWPTRSEIPDSRTSAKLGETDTSTAILKRKGIITILHRQKKRLTDFLRLLCAYEITHLKMKSSLTKKYLRNTILTSEATRFASLGSKFPTGYVCPHRQQLKRSKIVAKNSIRDITANLLYIQ